jgi:hypothetical protein
MALLPKPWPDTAPAVERLSPTRWRLRAPADSQLIEFFPYQQLQPEERDCTSEVTAAGREMHVESNVIWTLPAKGLVALTTTSGEPRYCEVLLP